MTTRRQMRLTPELVARVPFPPRHHLGAAPGSHAPEGQREANAAAILAKLPPDRSLWVFTYGSLMWKHGRMFEGEPVPGIIRGWHRAFCLGWDRGVRGNKQSPGLMLSLDRGGQCQGLAFRISRQHLADNLLSLLQREPPLPPRWVKVKTASGVLDAIAFTNDRKSDLYVGGLTHEQIADALAKACGRNGSMAEYLHNTIRHLQSLNIHDRHLWRMQDLVAARLEAPASTGTRLRF